VKYKFKHPKRKIIIAAVVFVVLIFVIRSCRSDNTVENDANEAFAVSAEVIGTAVLEEKIPITGSFEPLVSVEIVPEISGQLQKLRLGDGTPVDVGVVVKEGEVIAVINHDIYLAQLAEVKAAVEAGKVTLADAEREKNRMVKLFQAGSSTEQARDKAVTAAEMAAAQLRQAQAALEMVKVNVERATIKTPLNGIVAKKYVDEGNMVGPSTPLLNIVRIDELKVKGGVSERYLPQLKAGKTPVLITTDAYPNDSFQGTVFKVPVAVDPMTRTGEVEIRVPNKDGKLNPGMFARMTIVVNRKEAVVVPDAALIREYDNEYVFVVNDGKAHRRLLKLGISQGELYEVLDGLSVGDVVVTHGQNQLKDGQAVQVVDGAVK